MCTAPNMQKSPCLTSPKKSQSTKLFPNKRFFPVLPVFFDFVGPDSCFGEFGPRIDFVVFVEIFQLCGDRLFFGVFEPSSGLLWAVVIAILVLVPFSTFFGSRWVAGGISSVCMWGFIVWRWRCKWGGDN